MTEAYGYSMYNPTYYRRRNSKSPAFAEISKIKRYCEECKCKKKKVVAIMKGKVLCSECAEAEKGKR
jgi:hypothetical protein